jgi:hypothetical protein
MTDCKYANWLGADNAASWEQSWPTPDMVEDPEVSFVNDTCYLLLWMHIICFALLFGSQFYYFKSLDNCKISNQSLM